MAEETWKYHEKPAAPKFEQEKRDGEGPTPLMTEISKKVSWILRRGMKTLGDAEVDLDGFVKVRDLLTTSQLKFYNYDTLMEQINVSNEHKKRYDLKKDGDSEFWIRATKDRSDKNKRDSREKTDAAAKGDSPHNNNNHDHRGRTRSSHTYHSYVAATHDYSHYNGSSSWKENRSSWKNDNSSSWNENYYYNGSNEEKNSMSRDEDWADWAMAGGGRGGNRATTTYREEAGEREPWSEGKEAQGDGEMGKTWVVANNVPEVVVRDGISTDSPVKCTIVPGQVVTQIGPDKDVRWSGVIIRMEISYLDTETNTQCTGWVTQTAEDCRGPRYFFPPRTEWEQTRDANALRSTQDGSKSSSCSNHWEKESWDKKNTYGTETSDADTDGRSARNVASSIVSPTANSMISERLSGIEAPPHSYATNAPPHAPLGTTPSYHHVHVLSNEYEQDRKESSMSKQAGQQKQQGMTEHDVAAVFPRQHHVPSFATPAQKFLSMGTSTTASQEAQDSMHRLHTVDARWQWEHETRCLSTAVVDGGGGDESMAMKSADYTINKQRHMGIQYNKASRRGAEHNAGTLESNEAEGRRNGYY